jgi:uncharacterized delta-60 repeat protein
MPWVIRRSVSFVVLIVCLARPHPAAGQTPGQLDPSFDAGVVGFQAGTSEIRTVLLQPDGKLLVGGAFSSIAGVTRHAIARLNADGSVDATFVSPFFVNTQVPIVIAMARQPDGRILVGGNGLNVGAQNHFLARLMPDGAIDPSFTLLPMNASAGVEAIALLADGRFYIGGDYGSIGATTTRTLTRMFADGTVDTSFAIGAFLVSGRAVSIVVQPDGQVVAGGDYLVTLTAGGTTLGRLMRFSSTGAVDTSFDPRFGTNGFVPEVKSVVQAADGTFYAGGVWGPIDGTLVPPVARFSASGEVMPAFAPGIQGFGDAHALLLDARGRVLVTGNLYFPGTGPTNERRHIARLDPVTGAFDTFYPASGLENMGHALALQPDEKVIVAGRFFQVSGVDRWRVARLLDVANRAPVATADAYTTLMNQPLTVAAPGVLGNDADADGDPLTAQIALGTAPASGTVALAADGSFVFTPATGFTGVASFAYTARDGIVESAPATVSITVAPPPLTYLLAEGSTGGFFDLDVAIANPNALPAPIVVTFLRENGTTVTQSLTIAATAQHTLHVDAIPGLESTAVSTVVTSTAGLPLVVERSMFWDDSDYYGSHGANALAGPGTRWYFAEGSEGFFSTFLLLANATSSPATVTVSFLTESAGTIVRTYAVAPMARVTVAASSVPEIVNRSFAMVVDADVPIVAERAMYFGTARFWDGGHESTGVAAPSASWFLAEGATGAFFDTFILIANPNPSPTTVTLTFLTDLGQSIVRTHTVAANARLTVNMEGESPLLANASASTTVTATQPIVVERAMYWPGNGLQWSEAHNSFGVTATSTRWGLAEGRVGTTRAFATYILLANPSTTTAAQVQVTYLTTSGTPIVRTHLVNPTSRFNIDVNGQVPELAGQSFGALIEVTNGVGIVVERSLYNNALGQVWAAGTNALGTRLP